MFIKTCKKVTLFLIFFILLFFKAFISYGDYSGNSSITQNIFSISKIFYNVSYDLDGGSWDEGEENILLSYSSDNYGYVPPTPVKEGYVFDGWSPSSIADGSSGDIEFKASWREPTISILTTGMDFNDKIKDLSDTSYSSLKKMGKSYNSMNYTIEDIVVSDVMPESITETVDVSDENSAYNIVAGYDDVNNTVYVVSDADYIYLNEDSSYMFYNLIFLSSVDVKKFFTDNVKDMSYMFCNCWSLAELDLDNWNTSAVTTMYAMFYNCEELVRLDVSKFITSSVTNMSHIFSGCESLTTIDLSDWDTSEVTTMVCSFENCSSLTSLDIHRWNTENVTSMQSMFLDCSSLSDIYLKYWNVTSVTSFYEMFANCSSLVNLDLSDWNVEGSDSLASMFSGCTSLETLDLSNWNTSTIVTMNSMFNKCSNLRLLNLGDNFVMTKVTNKASMFLQSFSVSNSCVIVCSNEIQSKLKSGTSLTSSFVIFKTPAQYEAELPSVLFILNDDTVDGFNLNALVDEEFEEISN